MNYVQYWRNLSATAQGGLVKAVTRNVISKVDVDDEACKQFRFLGKI
jgi:hypothetical protein